MKDRRLPEGAEAAEEQIPVQHSQPVTNSPEVPGGNRAVGQLLAGSQAAPVLFGIDQTTRQIYVSVSVPGHPVADISTYLYGNPDRAADIQAANGIADMASPGSILRLPSGELAAEAQATVNRALGDGTILIDDFRGTPAGDVIDPAALTELDGDLTAHLEEHGPPDDVPEGVPETHWWWRGAG